MKIDGIGIKKAEEHWEALEKLIGASVTPEPKPPEPITNEDIHATS
jgi:hypothetical protein